MRSRLAALIGRLRAKYGPPSPPPAKTAFELVAWEKVAYLASDEKRASAFALLRRKIGLTPRRILAASRAELIDVLAAGGIAAPERANNLIKAAELVIGDLDGSLDDVCRGPLREAKKQLMRIYGIGEPGAEKILLMTRSHPVMGLDSNALRVLTRLGYGTARGSTSRGARRALLQLTRDMAAGKPVGFTVDGPRGPARVAQAGAVWLSKATGNPVLPFHLEASRHWTLNSWDRTQIPRPFATVALVMGEPFTVPADADVERARRSLEERLQKLERRATAMLS